MKQRSSSFRRGAGRYVLHTTTTTSARRASTGSAPRQKRSRSRSTASPVTVPEGTSIMRAAASVGRQHPEAVRHRHAEGVRLVPPVPGRDRRPPRLSRRRARRSVADGHEGADREPRSSTQLRRGVMELYISDHPLDCVSCPANGHCELQDMAAKLGITDIALRRWRQEPPARCQGHEQPVLHLRSDDVHRLLALRARVRRSAGHVRADDPGPRLRFEGRREPERAVHGVRVRVVRRVRRGVPDGRADREVADPARPARARRHDDLRVLRRRLLVQRRGRRTTRSSAWCRIATATPTTATPASRAASRSATPRIRIASRRR